MGRARWMRAAAIAASMAGLGCGADDAVFVAEERAPGERTPLTAACDVQLDPIRCHLPWPSSQFTEVDATTETGLRVALDDTAFDFADDRTSLRRADGFSRVTPLLVAFAGAPPAALGDEAMTLLVAEPGHPEYGMPVPLRVEAVSDAGPGNQTETFVVGYPRRPLPVNAAHVAVAFTGEGLVPTRGTRVALGLEAPADRTEAALQGYHAPTRAVLDAAGVDPSRVARVWDFVTRSQDDALAPVRMMREAALDALREASVAIDEVVVAPRPGVAMVVEGRLRGLPDFADPDRKRAWRPDADGDPVVMGTREAPFRLLVPAGDGDYRVVMYGHGMGGTFRDGTFDAELAENGVGKLGLQFYGWGDDTLETLAGIIEPAAGTDGAVTGLMQAFADGGALRVALSGVIGDAVSAPMIGGVANPAIGRRPDPSIASWAGGSLGGTMGMAFAAADPELRYAVLNVPGAAWTHFIGSSLFFAPLSGLLQISVGGEGDVLLALAMTQTNFDAIDGAIWAETMADAPSVFLIQESIDDPILPNIGSEMVAMASGASFVGEPLVPFGELARRDTVTEASAITQYRVLGDDLDVHGFGGEDGPAGEAARAQIRHFLRSAFEGRAEVVVPPGCPGARCDFTGE
ncbi:MAG: hypothetical protein AAF715_04080 [Myxococcota bacterium]